MFMFFFILVVLHGRAMGVSLIFRNKPNLVNSKIVFLLGHGLLLVAGGNFIDGIAISVILMKVL